MIVIIAVLCTTAFTLGGLTAAKHDDSSGIPPQHPIPLALRYKQELGLSPEQEQKLLKLHDDLAAEFAPFKDKAESIQHQMQDLQKSGSQDQNAAKALQDQAQQLGDQMRPLFDRYSKAVGDLLSPEQREKLMKLSEANSHATDDQQFLLMLVMQSRDQLAITPQQFTQLQYLQADFIRAFAPLREKMELLQMEVQQKFASKGNEPTAEYRDRGHDLQAQIAALQAQFSDRALKDVLQPQQRLKLEELRNGEHRSAQIGG